MPDCVAALYVYSDGIYAGLPDVDVWDEQRDARLYDGPHPVVAHPPPAFRDVLLALARCASVREDQLPDQEASWALR